LGGGVVWVSVFFFVVGYGLALLDGVVEVGLGEGLEGDESEAEGGCRGVEASVVFVGGFLSAKSGSLEENCDDEEREKGRESPLKDEIDVHGVPLRLVDRRRGSAQPARAAAMFSDGGDQACEGGGRWKRVYLTWALGAKAWSLRGA
jgi:hypothetical protein